MGQAAGPRRVPIPMSVWLLLGAFAVLVVASVIYGIGRYEDDLTARASKALDDAVIPVEVHFDGRHAYLTGELEYLDDLEQAVDVVANVRGVAAVGSDVVFALAGSRPVPVTVPPPPPATTPELTVRVDPGRLAVRGRVPSREEADAVLTGAAVLFGADAVIDQLEVREELDTSPWLARLPGLFESLAPLESGVVALGPAGAVVSGTVGSEEAKEEVGAAVVAVVGDLPVENLIVVVIPAEPRVEAAGADGVIRLAGAVPSDAAADHIVVAAEATGAAVDSELAAPPGVFERAWVAVIPDFIDALDALDVWSFVATTRPGGETGSVVVAGFAPDRAGLEVALRELVAAAASGGLTVDTAGIELAPEGVADELTRLLVGSTTFPSGGVTLSAEAEVLLDEAIAVLSANPSTALTVEGHTDDQGGAEANLALSRARADAVVAYLVSGGVDAGRLTAVGYGEERPIADNATPEGRAANRRIAFVVEGGGA